MLRKTCRALTLGLCLVASGAIAQAVDSADGAASQPPVNGQPNPSLDIVEAMRDRLATSDQFKVGQTLTLPVL